MAHSESVRTVEGARRFRSTPPPSALVEVSARVGVRAPDSSPHIGTRPPLAGTRLVPQQHDPSKRNDQGCSWLVVSARWPRWSVSLHCHSRACPLPGGCVHALRETARATTGARALGGGRFKPRPGPADHVVVPI